MEITTNVDGSKATIALAGKLTVATSPDLEKTVAELAEAGAASFDIDLSALEYISSAGLRVFLGTHKIAARNGGELRLLHPTESVMEVLDVTGFSQAMNIEQ